MTTMTTSEPESFCASSPEAQTMPEEDFWDHVFRHHMETAEHTENCEPDTFEVNDPVYGRTAPCKECGEPGVCWYDAEGRPMIHVERDDDDE